ncbi:hypothetical protein BH23ACT9_BH23ACT9_11190 [soil metagenome]
MSTPEDFDAREFAQRLREQLHTTVSAVEPDPAGWRELNARIRRRRTLVRSGGLALAGATAAVVAIAVLSPTGDRGVELAPAEPAAVATQPDDASSPAPGEGDGADGGDGGNGGNGGDGTVAATPAVAPEAGGMVRTDGSSIHVADLDGEIAWTVLMGEGDIAVTDLAVRPGGATLGFTMAYRYGQREQGDDAPIGDPDACGQLWWNQLVAPDADLYPGLIPAIGLPADGVLGGGGLTGDDLGATGCAGAPVFASDGSGLGWLAEMADGSVTLQTLDWSADGPVEGSLTTFGLELPDLRGPQLVGWTFVRQTGRAARGHLLLRAEGPEGLSLHRLPIERQADGAIALPQPLPLRPITLQALEVPGTVVGTSGDWSAVRLTSDGDADVIGLAYTPVGDAPAGDAPAGDGTTARPLVDVLLDPSPDDRRTLAATVETDLRLDPAAAPYVDAIGDTAIAGGGGALRVVRWAPDATSVDAPPFEIVSAVLLATPETALDPDRVVEGNPGDPTGSPATTPSPSDVPHSRPTPTPVPTINPTVPPVDAAGPAPAAVTMTASAIRSAAQAGDYEAIAALIPASGFTSNFGGQSDHIAFYRAEEANGIDVLGTLSTLLAAEGSTTDGSLWVWPDVYLTDPEYLGYRVGVASDGTWQFYVAGD